MATTQTPFPTSPSSPSSTSSSTASPSSTTGSGLGSSSAGATSSGSATSLGGGATGSGLSGSSGMGGSGLGSSGAGSSGSMGGSTSSMDRSYGGASDSSSMSGSDGSMGRNERMERVVQSAHQAVDTLAAKAAPLVDRFSSGLDGASGQMHDRADQLTAMQEEWVESARTTVREHPLASLAAAVAVGMLISRLSR